MAFDPISFNKANEAKELAEQIIDGDIETGVLKTNIEKKLNDKEAEYAPELANVKTQLAETATQVGVLSNPLKTRNIHTDFYPPTENDGLDGDLWIVLIDGSNRIPIKVEEWEQGTLLGANGQEGASADRIRTVDFIEILGGQNIQFRFETPLSEKVVVGTYLEYKSDGTFIQTSGWQPPGVYTLHESTEKCRFVFAYQKPSAIVPNDIIRIKPSVKEG